MKKIDIHSHTSEHKMYGLYTTDATLGTINDLMRKHEVILTTIMSTCFPFKGTGLTIEDLIHRLDRDRMEIKKQNKLVFATFDASKTRGFHTRFERFKQLVQAHRPDGIKLYPGYQNFSMNDEHMIPVYYFIRDQRLPVAIHGGELHHCCPSGTNKCGRDFCPLDRNTDMSRPQNMVRAFGAFPDIKFCVCHLANPYFDELREVMKQFPNVLTDTSGQWVTGGKDDNYGYRESIVEELFRFLELPNGINRIMFGTDFPITSYNDAIWLIEALGLDEEDKANIYLLNAINFIGGK